MKRRGQRYVNRMTKGVPGIKRGACGYAEGFTILPNGMEFQDYTWARREYMMYLYEQGLTYDAIARRTGATRQAVHQGLIAHHKKVKNLVSRVANLLDYLV